MADHRAPLLHRRGRPAGAVEAPVVAGDRGAVLPRVAVPVDVRAAQARSPTDDRRDAHHRALLHGAPRVVRARKHQLRVLLHVHSSVRAPARLRVRVLLRAVPDPRPARSGRTGRARPGRRVRLARAARFVRDAAPLRDQRVQLSDLALRRPLGLPRRFPARRPRLLARHRGRGPSRFGCRAGARLQTAALDRRALVQPLPLALPHLLRDPARARHPSARHLVPFDPLRGLAGLRRAPDPLVRGGRDLVPFRGNPDPQGRDRPLP